MPRIPKDAQRRFLEAMSFDDLEQKIRDLIDPADAEGRRTWRYWIKETYPGYVVVKDDNDSKLYRVEYTVDGEENVTLGQWQEAEYVLQIKPGGATFSQPEPASEVLTESAAEDLDILELTPLVEAQGNAAGNAFRVTVLKPGWNRTLEGKDGDKYYTREACASLAPLLENAKAYADHPTRQEEHQRPERSIRDLVGWYTEARQEPDGRTTAVLNLFESAGWLKEILALIAGGKAPKNLAGISLNGFGPTRIGTVDGRRGKIVESVSILRSSDVVTEAAAGGEVERLVASAAGSAKPKGEDQEVDWKDITIEALREHRPDLVEAVGQARLTEAKGDFQKELDSLKESVQAVAAENQRLRTDLATEKLKGTAKERIRELLRESKLPEISQRRLAALLEGRDFTKDGAVDEAALKEAVDSAVAGEKEYITRLTESGRVVNMGGGEPPDPAKKAEEVQGKLDRMFGAAGQPEQK